MNTKGMKKEDLIELCTRQQEEIDSYKARIFLMGKEFAEYSVHSEDTIKNLNSYIKYLEMQGEDYE